MINIEYMTHTFKRRITALIVDADMRSSGVGRSLVTVADSYFLKNNCIKAEVTSGDQRKVAHYFYEALGYLEDQRRFIKHYK